MRALIQRFHRDERGVSMVLMAFALVGFLGFAAIVVDLGNGWRNRRALIPGTDAAALAAAQDRVDGLSEAAACTTAQSYLGFNAPTATMAGSNAPCPVFSGTADRGWVEVQATVSSEAWFSRVLGFNDFDVDSATLAAWGTPTFVNGMRPMGLCLAGSSALQAMAANPPTSPTTLVIPYDYTQPDPCGGVPGNWGYIDFDGGPSPSGELEDRIEFGATEQVYFGDDAPGACPFGEQHCYSMRSGTAAANIRDELDYLVNNDIIFVLPIFDYAEPDPTGIPPGTVFKAHIMGIIRVELQGYNILGAQSTHYFEFLVQPGVVDGGCCDGGGNAVGSKAIAICGVDPGDSSDC
jgi:Flp pilus assembly protein TadG